MASWLGRVLEGSPGFERELVDRYTTRLVALAGCQLPERIRRRVDPEDVVQSVYRSFFRRLKDGQFAFDDSQDLWRLLAAMTFRKACNARKFHLRDRRDARRDFSLTPPKGTDAPAWEEALATPQEEDIGLLYECLEKLLEDLPENYRTIVVRRLEGDSIDEIAKQVQRSRRTVLRVLAHITETAAAEDE
jgi:RNA polymerase sigma-70 factor (ECF subfamily)